VSLSFLAVSQPVSNPEKLPVREPFQRPGVSDDGTRDSCSTPATEVGSRSDFDKPVKFHAASRALGRAPESPRHPLLIRARCASSPAVYRQGQHYRQSVHGGPTKTEDGEKQNEV
ncbi:hypothetical protein CSUI_000790, partial [Cystoisospora suis]